MYDLIVIGSGAASFSAAIRAVEGGAKVAMVEKGTVGGTCVNVGCVPSKTLLRAGDIQRTANHQPFKGLNLSAEAPDLSKLKNQKDALVNQLRQEKYENLIEDYGFEFIKGEASFVDEKTITVSGEKFSTKHFLIATGASPAIPAIPGLSEIDFLTSTTALDLTEVPKSIAIIGAGYVAMELGQLFRNLGSEVTLLQRSDRVMKEYDQEISDTVEKVLIDEGIKIKTGVTYKKIDEVDDKKRIHYIQSGAKHTIEADEVIVAAGRNPNTTSLKLENAGVELGDAGEVKTNEYLQTNVPHIYAAGDVTLGPQFVYVAAYEGGLVAKNILQEEKQKVDLSTVPAVTFTNPSIASVGKTEQQAIKEGLEVQTSVLPLESVPRALANQEMNGLFKLVIDANTKRLLGAQVVSENAGDVIYAATLAVKFNLTADDIKDTMAPYLTMAEGIKLASLSFDKDVSKLSCCAG
ncbi:mercury(II) reductase [Alkalihalobacillus berkeleyi]|uniref:Mercuric reductase n=1 Tax=Pseudalkalibacillus berkeleyi TaxID=1069813 RepID=A0ABS9GUA9_9BACL|nr:mercury(II) reductase [Pseudalkalibacillus berkeleyi]